MMKIVTSFLFVLSSVLIVLADIPPSSKENKPTNEGTCVGVMLFLTAIAILGGWLLKKQRMPRDE